MGYTHYWRAKNGGEFSPESWAKIKADVEQLIAASDVPLYFEDDSREPPEVTDTLIRFNGETKNGHEKFWLGRELDDFQFCKTAYKPYDKVVVAVLAVAAEHAPDTIVVSSDGDKDDWQAGLTWASTALGRPIPFPVKEDEDA